MNGEPRTTAGRRHVNELTPVVEWQEGSRSDLVADVLAIEEEAAALDVDRLDRAMAAAGVHVDPARPGPTRPVGCRSCADGIRRIAREYAALVSAARDRVGTEEPGP